MIHRDHVRLIQKGITREIGEVWTDFGSGEGAFTLALAERVGLDAEIYSVDKNKDSLQVQKEQFERQFPETNIHFLHADFMENLKLPKLDGLLAANSMHFQSNTLAVVEHFMHFLKPGGKFIVVEYNVDNGNRWVPYPFSYSTFKQLAFQAGLRQIELLATIPSGFLQEIYAAQAVLER